MDIKVMCCGKEVQPEFAGKSQGTILKDFRCPDCGQYVEMSYAETRRPGNATADQ